MSDITFNCPACGQHLAVDVSGVGMTIACPVCAAPIAIPRASQAHPPQAPLGQMTKKRPHKPAFLVALTLAMVTVLATGVWFLNQGSWRRGLKLPESAPSRVQAREARDTEPSASDEPPQVLTRTLSFPARQRVGTVFVEPETGPGWDPVTVNLPTAWEDLCAAQGEGRVPQGRSVQLMVRLALSPQEAAALRARNPRQHYYFEACRFRPDPEDLSGLAKLQANDVQRLMIESLVTFADADRRVLEPIRHLTGLQILGLYGTGVTDKGMEHLRSLRSLKMLELNEPSISSQGLSVLLDLPALESLDLDTGVTDDGLAQIGQHPNLRRLRILTGKFSGTGLAELAHMPHLEGLCFWGQVNLTDHQIRQLEGLTHLKTLAIWSVGDWLTDASLASIAKLTNLEELRFIRTSPRYTAAGVELLKGLTHLKAVDFAAIWLSPQGIRYGDNLAALMAKTFPRLERLKGLSFLSATGLKTLTALQNLKSLEVGLKDPEQGYKGPTGLAELADLDGLEELAISTRAKLSEADLAGLAPLGKLRELSLLTSRLSDGCLASIGNLKHLERLWINCASRKGLNYLNGLSQLQMLQASSWGDPADANLADETTLDLKGLTSLKNLNLSGIPLQDADLAFLVHLPRLEQLFISADALTGAFLRHLKNLPQLRRLNVDRVSACTGEDLAQLNALPKLREVTLSGEIPCAALAALTGPPSLKSLDINTRDSVPQQAISEMARTHPALEYFRVNPDPSQLTR